jgi:hypothetical protein
MLKAQGYLGKTLSYRRRDQRGGDSYQPAGNQQRDQEEDDLATHAIR